MFIKLPNYDKERFDIFLEILRLFVFSCAVPLFVRVFGRLGLFTWCLWFLPQVFLELSDLVFQSFPQKLPGSTWGYRSSGWGLCSSFADIGTLEVTSCPWVPLQAGLTSLDFVSMVTAFVLYSSNCWTCAWRRPRRCGSVHHQGT